MKQTTIKDVATLAGVSKTTVSHVVNDSRFVGEGTCQKVLQAIPELQYRSSAAARSLTTKRTVTVGIVISDSFNPFFGELLISIEEVLRPHNHAFHLQHERNT